jgi:hypothetical protein
MDQARLRLLQFAKCGLGSVARRANGFFGLLPLGNICIDQNEAATGHRIPAHFDDAAIGSRPLEPQLPACIVESAAQFRLEIGRVLAARGEVPEILDIARPLSEEGVGQIEYLLEIAIPRNKSGVGA